MQFFMGDMGYGVNIPSEDAAKQVARKMLLTQNRRNPLTMAYVNFAIIATQEEPYYPMAANILEQLPRNDTTTICSLLRNFLNEDGTEKPMPGNIPERFVRAYKNILMSLEDPQIAMNCLLEADQPGLFHYFTNRISPEMLTLDYAEKLALGLSHQILTTPETWNKYFELCGQYFSKDDGTFDVDRFLKLKEDKKSQSLNELLFVNASIPILQYFADKDRLDFKQLLQPYNSENSNIKLRGLTAPLPKYLDTLEFILRESRITKEDILSADPHFYDIFFYQYIFGIPNEEEIQQGQFKRLIPLLDMTKEEFLKNKKRVSGDGTEAAAICVLYGIIGSPNTEVKKRAPIIMEALGITRQEIIQQCQFITEDFLNKNGFPDTLRTSVE